MLRCSNNAVSKTKSMRPTKRITEPCSYSSLSASIVISSWTLWCLGALKHLMSLTNRLNRTQPVHGPKSCVGLGYYVAALRLTSIVRWCISRPNQFFSFHFITHHPSLFHSKLKRSFSANPSHCSLPFLLQDWLHGFLGLFTDTSELIRF